jgi:hypothetical protein
LAELGDIKKTLTGLIEGVIANRNLNRYGLAAIRLMKTRTREGISIDGSPFPEYSPGYKKKKEKAGLPVSPVNLTFNDVDGMLTKVDHVALRSFEGVEVFIRDPEKEQIAYYLSVAGAGINRKLFPFWGLNKDEDEQITELIAADIAGELRELVNRVS